MEYDRAIFNKYLNHYMNMKDRGQCKKRKRSEFELFGPWWIYAYRNSTLLLRNLFISCYQHNVDRFYPFECRSKSMWILETAVSGITIAFLKCEFTLVLTRDDSSANDIMVISSIIDFALLHDPTCDRDFTFPFLWIAARTVTLCRGYARALP